MKSTTLSEEDLVVDSVLRLVQHFLHHTGVGVFVTIGLSWAREPFCSHVVTGFTFFLTLENHQAPSFVTSRCAG